jgi:hypothetical protein
LWLVDGTEQLGSIGRHIMLSDTGVLQFSQLRFEMVYIAFRGPVARASLRSILTGNSPIRAFGTGALDGKSQHIERSIT